MSLSSNTAQTRELTELRNHLKWLDEERRKSSKKMAELEQRLAQQGRELADRDQKIQDLEWHIANFAERFERLPDLDSNAAGTEQRLQDLEWHLSNMNSQITRLPNPEEERARMQEDIARAISSIQERVDSEQSLLESRLRTEMVSLRESDEHRLLTIRQDEQFHAINELDEKLAALQESVGILSGQLRERTSTLAAESQANISSLAAGLQEHLDAMTAENQTRLDFFAAEWQTRLDEISSTRVAEPSPELLRLDERLGEISQTQEQWPLRWSQMEQELAQLREELGAIGPQIEPLIGQVGQRYDDRIEELRLQLEPLRAGYGEVNEKVAQIGQQIDAQLDPLANRQIDLEQQISHLGLQLEGIGNQIDPLNSRSVKVEQQLADLGQLVIEIGNQIDPLNAHSVDADQRLADLGQLVTEIGNQIDPLNAHGVDVDQRLADLGQLITEIRGTLEPIDARQSLMEENLEKLGHIREIMPLLDRLEQELELRQAEEVRLSNLIGTQENRFAPLATSLEEVKETNGLLLARIGEAENLITELRAGVQDFNDNWKPAVSEMNRRLSPVTERLTGLSNSVSKVEAGIQSLTSDQAELRETTVNLTDDIRRNQSDIARQLEGWQATLDENKDTIERFTQQWITLSNQYKEARMAVQNFAHWQKQLEQQKREASEMLRVESNRMQSRWDGFMMEIQEKLKNFELDLNQKWQAFEIENEQKWSAARRNDQLRHEELAAVDELIQKLQQDNRNLIWRVQAAQADAIKKWPRLLMEEVEKAVELNPNRRLTTATTPRSDMSVVDAIEQGLITIDYSDETPGDI